MGKTIRKPYSKSKKFDSSCRNHGRCSWCEGNRTIQTKKVHLKVIQELKESE